MTSGHVGNSDFLNQSQGEIKKLPIIVVRNAKTSNIKPELNCH